MNALLSDLTELVFFYDLMVLYISHYSYTVENTQPLIQYFNTNSIQYSQSPKQTHDVSFGEVGF